MYGSNRDSRREKTTLRRHDASSGLSGERVKVSWEVMLMEQTLSHCQFRMMGGEENDKSASEFVQLSLKSAPVSCVMQQASKADTPESLLGRIARSKCRGSTEFGKNAGTA